jgi:hypothetical protein
MCMGINRMYVELYNISSANPFSVSNAASLLLTLIALFLLMPSLEGYRDRLLINKTHYLAARPTEAKKWNRFLAWCFLIFSICWQGLTLGTNIKLRLDHKLGKFQTVEGVVREFTPGDGWQRINERFIVAGREFSYSDTMETGAYNTTAAHGGVIKEGMLIRISYVSNKIIRIEQLDRHR